MSPRLLLQSHSARIVYPVCTLRTTCVCFGDGSAAIVKGLLRHRKSAAGQVFWEAVGGGEEKNISIYTHTYTRISNRHSVPVVIISCIPTTRLTLVPTYVFAYKYYSGERAVQTVQQFNQGRRVENDDRQRGNAALHVYPSQFHKSLKIFASVCDTLQWLYVINE